MATTWTRTVDIWIKWWDVRGLVCAQSNINSHCVRQTFLCILFVPTEYNKWKWYYRCVDPAQTEMELKTDVWCRSQNVSFFLWFVTWSLALRRFSRTMPILSKLPCQAHRLIFYPIRDRLRVCIAFCICNKCWPNMMWNSNENKLIRCFVWWSLSLDFSLNIVVLIFVAICSEQFIYFFSSYIFGLFFIFIMIVYLLLLF